MKFKVLCLCLLILPLAITVQAQDNDEGFVHPDASNYQWTLISDLFENPLYLTHAGDGSGRLFVVEQTGMILIIEPGGEVLFEPFLDISGMLTREVFQGGYTERGLIGLEFHPNYAENGEFFIHYINQAEEQVIARYRVSADDPNRADPNSEEVILTFQDVFPNHNGGQLEFGPDGYLYISIGDGGELGDPLGNGQNPGVYFAKMLRIDPDGGDPYAIPPDNPHVDDPEHLPETWAMGLRNPWRFSFDSETGDLYIADVGETAWEEINFQPADSTGGENYGWNAYEGTRPFNLDTPVPRGMRLPALYYGHDMGCSVTGGYVYRGEAHPELDGFYFYGDYCSGWVWTAIRDSDGVWSSEPFMQTSFQISSFGVDQDNELYVVDYKGDVYRLDAAE